MGTTKDITCKKCGAIVKGDVTYCPHCGELLPGKTESITISKRERDLLTTNYKVLERIYKTGHAPSGMHLIGEDYFDNIENIKKKADRYDTISMWTLLISIGLGIILFFTGLYYVIDRFQRETKTGLEIVKDEATGKYGIYNHDKDSLVTPYEYDSIQYRNWVDAESYKRNYFVLFKNTLLGIADSTGTVSISCELDEIEGAYSGLIIMRKNGYEGLFDTYGTPLFRTNNYHVLWDKKPVLDSRTPGTYVGNIIPVKRNTNSGWELFNRAGKKIINKTYPEVTQTGTSDLIKVKYNGYYGLINKKGEEVVKCNADWILRFREGMAVVYISKPYNVYAIDTLGNKVVFQSFPNDWSIWYFRSAFIAVRDESNGKIGYYDKTGKQVISHEFEQAQDGNTWIDPSFQGDSARVSSQGRNGYVFKDGNFKPDAK